MTMKKYLINNFDGSKLINVFDELPLWSAPFGLKLLDYICYKPDISVLDIGFGTGFPLTEIAMRLGDSCIIYGIDPWENAIQKAKEKIDYYGINNIRIIEGVAESIPLKNNSIDLITSNNGLNNVSDIDKSLDECFRIMKKGGQFIQTLNMNQSMFEFYNILETVLDEFNLSKEIELMRTHIETKRPSIEKYLNKIRKAGFIIKDVEQDQFNYQFVNGTALLNHYFIRLAFITSWIEFLPQSKLNDIFDKIENQLNIQSEQTGSLKLSIPYVLINAIKV